MGSSRLVWYFLTGLLAISAPTLSSQKMPHPNTLARESASEEVGNEEYRAPNQADQRSEFLRSVRSLLPGQDASTLRLKAFAQRGQLARTSSHRKQQAKLDFNANAWQSIGPSPLVSGTENFSGRVPAIAVDPTNANNLFIGTADGGVWQSTDGGTTWKALTDNEPSLAIGALAIDPTNPNVIYAGTGEPFPASQFTYSAGLLKTTDGGATWIDIQQPFLSTGPATPYSISQIAIDPHNPRIILAASPNGALFRSTDAGATWSISAQGEFDAVAFDANQQGAAYVGVIAWQNGNPQVWHSADSGATWSQVNVDASVGSRIVMAIASDSTLYVAVAFDSARLYKSTDGGQTFLRLNNTIAGTNSQNLCPDQCSYNFAIAVSPKNPNEIWFGGLWLNRSLDGGQTWEELYGNYHTDQHAIAFSSAGDRVYAGNDGGIYESTTPEASADTALVNLNNGLATLQFYSGISMSPGDVASGLGGMQDNGTAAYGGSPSWAAVWGGDGVNTAIDPTNPSILYTTSQNGNIYRSSAGANTSDFSTFMKGLPANSGPFNTSLAIDNSDPNRLYTYTNGQFYRTVDGSGNWQLSSSLPASAPAPLAINVSPVDHNVLWAATFNLTGNAGYITQNAAGAAMPTWTALTVTFQRNMTRIAPDPLDTTVGYGTVSGYAAFSNDNAGHVIRFDNYGASWAPIGMGLPDVPANDLVVDPGLPDTMYVATDVGVFVTTDAGASWSPMNNGLPNVIVTGLVLDNQTRTLRAGTHGRSMWQTTLPPALVFRASTSSLGFSSQGGGIASAPQTFLVLNSSPQSISLLTATVGPFAETNSCAGQLSPGQYCTYSVVFTPTVNGPATGSLQLTDPNSGYAVRVALSGTASALSFPASVSFGNVDPGSSAHQAITFTNSSTAPLTITSMTASGDFQLGAPSCLNVTMQPGSTCSQSITFSPTTAGARTGTLVVSDSVDEIQQTLALEGVGSDFSITLATSQISLQPGGSGFVTVNLSSSTNFSDAITLSCNGVSPGVSCNFQPTAVTLASGTGTTTLSITNRSVTAHSDPAKKVKPHLAVVLAVALFGILFLTENYSEKRSRTRVYLMLSLFAMAIMLACGGSSPNPAMSPGPGGNTPVASGQSSPNVISVAVKAQAGTVQHTAILTVSIQP